MKSYFKGWYFKLQNAEDTIALIPSSHTDKNGITTASLQIISGGGAWNVPFTCEDFYAHPKNLLIKIGKNLFSEHGITINVKQDDLTISGSVIFGALSPIKYDIMGPFALVPFMECRHSILSMTHTVNGILTINGKTFIFDDSVGYIEGDRGSSFPREYSWTQSNFWDDVPCSVCLSVADIPLGLVNFTGIIGIVLWRGKEYRIATYLGARVIHIKDGKIVVKQNDLTLTVQLLERKGHLLKAPILGDMARTITESPSCTAFYHFEQNNKTLFEFETTQAAFEYEYKK